MRITTFRATMAATALVLGSAAANAAQTAPGSERAFNPQPEPPATPITQPTAKRLPGVRKVRPGLAHGVKPKGAATARSQQTETWAASPSSFHTRTTPIGANAAS